MSAYDLSPFVSVDECLGGDYCECDEHAEVCQTCGGQGFVEKLLGSWSVDLPCPDCDLGDAA